MERPGLRRKKDRSITPTGETAELGIKTHEKLRAFKRDLDYKAQSRHSEAGCISNRSEIKAREGRGEKIYICRHRKLCLRRNSSKFRSVAYCGYPGAHLMAKTLSVQWSGCISLTMGLRPAFLLDCGLFIEPICRAKSFWDFIPLFFSLL